MDFAKRLNDYRVFPRIMVSACIGYIGWYAWQVSDWYMGLGTVSTTENMGFAIAVVGLVTTVLNFILSNYMNSGNSDDN